MRLTRCIPCKPPSSRRDDSVRLLAPPTYLGSAVADACRGQSPDGRATPHRRCRQDDAIDRRRIRERMTATSVAVSASPNIAAVGRDVAEERHRMRPFTYEALADARGAIAAVSNRRPPSTSRGTQFVDLMTPTSNSATNLVGHHAAAVQTSMRRRAAVCASARRCRTPIRRERAHPRALAGASGRHSWPSLPTAAQTRRPSRASRQRSAAWYFYDTAAGFQIIATTGHGMPAIGGFNRIHALSAQATRGSRRIPRTWRLALAALGADRAARCG